MQSTTIPEIIPRIANIKEPQVVALVATFRAGTKILQSYLDQHPNILMIPGYPLLYLYPHWSTWRQQFSSDFTWERAIDLFCEKHASVLDSRQIPGFSGLERLGPHKDEHIEIDEQLFRSSLESMLEGLPVSRRTFLLAIHYSYAVAKGWDLNMKSVLLYHSHDPHFLKPLAEDFPDLKVLTMARNPRASLHSATRLYRIIDDAKLNATDSLLYASRSCRLACYHHFSVLDNLGSFLENGQVTSFKLESLYRDLEQGMRRVTDWLGIDFSQGMLQSTFDGKLWWGDVATQVPVNGLDPSAVSERWKESLNKIDAFVVEGICYHLLEEYDYEKSAYRCDTPLNRLLLFFAILLPSKAEWKTAGFYLDPRTHARFLRAAFEEGAGRVALKDYTWNATYLYKWTYLDLKLWQPRWHQRLLRFAENLRRSGGRRPMTSGVTALGCAAYVTTRYLRFWTAIVTLPLQIFLRWNIQYRSLRRRLWGTSFLPKLLK